MLFEKHARLFVVPSFFVGASPAIAAITTMYIYHFYFSIMSVLVAHDSLKALSATSCVVRFYARPEGSFKMSFRT
jgi:hypothetical protein